MQTISFILASDCILDKISNTIILQGIKKKNFAFLQAVVHIMNSFNVNKSATGKSLVVSTSINI